MSRVGNDRVHGNLTGGRGRGEMSGEKATGGGVHHRGGGA